MSLDTSSMASSAGNTEPVPADLARPAETAELMPAQGIQCGALNLAFPYTWARAIVDDFSVTPVPNAPAWLTGAANVEGEIVPVFDLASWIAADTPGTGPAELGADRARLLVGGQEGDRAAILFSGSARMVRYASDDARALIGLAVPERLRDAVLATSETAPPHWVLNARRLFDTLADELTS